ncbi:MAG: DUF1223 domain-containing protein [Alphaproteobacteria bacterium]|nr:DUF1223 domain-containing protein [Alphaproteobacteria bacterium]
MLRRHPHLWIVLAALTALATDSAGAAESAAPVATDAHPAPVVVELFTSQGCSSCRPADAYFGELAKRPDVIALGFHVDYWNYIGWDDPFAKSWATARQRGYQDSLKTRFVYTPQIVVDGAAEVVGSDDEKCDALIDAAKAKATSGPTLALHWRADGALAVDVGSGESPAGQPATLWLIGFDSTHTTQVLRGENEGRTITDVHPVRSYSQLGKWAGWSAEIIVPAAKVKTLGDGGIAVLLQEHGTGPILTAAEIAQR